MMKDGTAMMAAIIQLTTEIGELRGEVKALKSENEYLRDLLKRKIESREETE